MTFRRARTDDQRDERRRAVLGALAEMLAEMPVAQVSLNELARRVGLAKSNVLRYVESREAALLALLDERLVEWVEELESAHPVVGTPRERVDALADLFATTLTTRPVLCDLLAAQSAVLERNVSTDVALRYKQGLRELGLRLAGVVRRFLGELDDDAAFQLGAGTLLCAGTVFTACRPTPAMAAVYELDPTLAAMRVLLPDTLRELVAVFASGLVARA
ncbi:TetR/AcrR family transcriptional regulator [Actinomycetospora soli]|uniref:TetR/AcrR family transcriptional regulator n=1 Tax=Actinomycetospora soli TaxID=2893887 RepID=UPI001E411E59|nr:TetR/AcrR family transcriptional regulator [Actinomycetospora soli]MCD2188355.1 TetR/AcrR family transcriptional regulator [Actinomycetospora soli]